MSDFNVKIPATFTALELNIFDVVVAIADFMRATPGFDDSDQQTLNELIKRIKRVKGNQNIVGSGNYQHRGG